MPFMWFLIIAATPVAAALAVSLGLELALNSWRDVLVFLVLAPLLEEWIFRGNLQHMLTQRSQRPFSANLIMSTVFVIFHWQGQGEYVLLWFVPSLVLGEVWRRYESLRLNVLLHASFNVALWVASQ